MTEEIEIRIALDPAGEPYIEARRKFGEHLKAKAWLYLDAEKQMQIMAPRGYKITARHR